VSDVHGGGYVLVLDGKTFEEIARVRLPTACHTSSTAAGYLKDQGITCSNINAMQIKLSSRKCSQFLRLVEPQI